MGAGIAQLAAQAGARALLHDPIPEALERGVARIGSMLDRQVAKGRMEEADAAAVRGRVEAAPELSALAPCGIVIEAAPERLELKLDLYRQLAEIVAADCVLATNTSSLSVTEIAAGTPGPERVVGLHFFNPAPVMKLVELVAGAESGAAALATARAVGEAMGKRVIDAADVAGFLVNRCNRPYSLEGLRLLETRIATVEQIDRVARLGGGFRMGPFELIDLVGLDVNLAVAESMQRASYGEPRYRPSPLQARMVAARRLGRKTGRGWYEYPEGGGEHRPADADPPAAGGGDGRPLLIAGALPIAEALRAAASDAGYDVRAEAAGTEPWLVVACDDPEPTDASDAPLALLVHDASLHQLDPTAVGFHALPPFDECRLVELTSTPATSPVARQRMEELVHTLGRHVEYVGDAPGLVLGRIVCQLINEAAFLIGEGNGAPADVDAGMQLGVNHPRGPVAWSDAIGLDHVLAVLDALRDELGEERYRAAPLLRAKASLGGSLSDA